MYIAHFRPPRRLWDKAFYIREGNIVEITDTPAAKRRFLRKFKDEVLFGEKYSRDEIFSKQLRPAEAPSKELLAPFAADMAKEALAFTKSPLPVGEIALFCAEGWERTARKLLPLTRLITIVGRGGEGETLDGVALRFVAKLRGRPDLAVIFDENAVFSPLFNVPTVDLRESCREGALVMTHESVAFQMPPILSPLGDTLNAPQAAYFLSKGLNFSPEIISFRKKSSRIFTLY